MHFFHILLRFFSFFAQVWFQNARAKWRRMMMKQEGKAIDGEKGEGSIDLDTYNPHSPSYMLPCGPPSPSIE
jgi:LIM homeobox protein 2/9